MNERSSRYAINALKERRAEIDGEIEAYRRCLENFTEAIVHLDASIALLDPTYDPASVRPKKLYRRAKLFGGRKLTGPLSWTPYGERSGRYRRKRLSRLSQASAPALRT